MGINQLILVLGLFAQVSAAICRNCCSVAAEQQQLHSGGPKQLVNVMRSTSTA
jgi:hypothetical protein